MTLKEKIAHGVAQPDVMKVWRNARAQLIERGVRCPIAETYAKEIATAWRRAVLDGDDEAAELATGPETIARSVKAYRGLN